LRYRIFRGPAMNAMVQIDSVPSTVLTYHDTLPPPNSFYLLEAVNPSSPCIPTTSIRRHGISSFNLSGSYSNGFNTANITTGLQNKGIGASNVDIYPNPANNILNISINAVSSHTDFYLTDMLDRNVFTDKDISVNRGFKETINMESLQPGVYFLIIESNGQRLVKKVTKL
jgi:lysyl endopeptidase